FYEYIDDPDHYMHYFIDGAILPIREVDTEYESVSYMGLSGGGTTGLVACAVFCFDHCILVAGFLPDEIAISDRANVGDIEQFSRSFYHIFRIEQLMHAARDRSRLLTLYYNRFDPCCFSDPQVTQFRNRYPDYNIILTDLQVHGYDNDHILA